MTSHWIPPFTRTLPNGDQQACCGEFVRPEQFSTDPTCEACRRYLADDAETAVALEQDFPEFKGRLITPTDPRRV